MSSWKCKACGLVNFASAGICKRCETSQEVGHALAGVSEATRVKLYSDPATGASTSLADSEAYWAQTITTEFSEQQELVLKKALRQINSAAFAALIIAAITFGAIIQGPRDGVPYTVIEAKIMLAFSVGFGALSIGIWCKSRACAVLTLLLFLTDKYFVFQQGKLPFLSWIFVVLFLYLYGEGVTGTFTWQRIMYVNPNFGQESGASLSRQVIGLFFQINWIDFAKHLITTGKNIVVALLKINWIELGKHLSIKLQNAVDAWAVTALSLADRQPGFDSLPPRQALMRLSFKTAFIGIILVIISKALSQVVVKILGNSGLDSLHHGIQGLIQNGQSIGFLIIAAGGVFLLTAFFKGASLSRKNTSFRPSVRQASFLDNC